jgi:hypothetical protein
MRIDIDGFTEAELIDLNHRIVERLKFLNHMRAHAQMLEFRIGDRVSFQLEGRPVQVGMLTRYNKKTVTVLPKAGSTGTSLQGCCAALITRRLTTLQVT